MNRAVMILGLTLAVQPALAQGPDEQAAQAEKTAPVKTKPGASGPAKTKPKDAPAEDAESATDEAATPEAPAAAPVTPTPTPAPPPAPPAADDDFGDLPAFDDIGSTDDLGGLGGDLQANWDAAAGPESRVSFPWVEQHGYFRLRTDLFYNLDLDTFVDATRRSSAIDPPLSEQDSVGRPGHPEDQIDNIDTGTFSRDSETLAGANIRFRYQPTLHISESLRVRATFDVLDNLVLGSTADGSPRSAFGRPDVELPFFSETQRSPASGVDSFSDAVRVKHLWGEWQTPLGLLSMGRTQAHWGLGMVVNNGACLDCDFGDTIDRIMATTQILDTYLSVTWDFPVEGAVGMPGVASSRTEAGGQAYDLDQRDDVNQWTVAIYKKPYSLEEKEKRARDLDELGDWTFDAGLYTIIRTQVFESDVPAGGVPAEDEVGYVLYETDAWSITPDVWVDFQYRPNADSSVRVQAEGALVVGAIEELPMHAGEEQPGCGVTLAEGAICDDPIDTRRRDILRYGWAVEVDARYKSLNYGLHHGFASGDDQEGFGFRDQNRLGDDSFESFDNTLSLFRFDRDYHVDTILFREVLGGVSNAMYFKPYLGYDLVDESDEAWGFSLSAMYASALEANATPGNANSLGLEFNAEFYIHEFDSFRWSLNYAVLFAGEALSVTDATGEVFDPGVAQSVQMFLGMEF